jgi:hypothetical protein
MAFNFAAAKAALRRSVHDTFGVGAFYQDSSLSAPTPVIARYHHKKLDQIGDLVEAGYAETMVSVERIVFEPAATPGITFVRNGRVTLDDLPGVEFLLTVRDPIKNQLEEVWQVVRS